MRGFPQGRSANRGSALLAALCFCAVLGIGLASYMGVCYHTLQTSTRNNFGTYSFELAETGMEEALAALNRSSFDWADWTLDNTSTPKTATKTVTGFSFGNGASGTVVISIENYDGRQTGLNPTLKVTGTTSLADGLVVTRTLRATAKLAPMFVNAVAATFVNSPTSSSFVANSSRGLRLLGGGFVNSLDSNPVVPPGEDTAARETRERLASYSAVMSSGNRVILSGGEIDGYVSAATDSPSAPDTAGTLLLSYTSDTRVVGPTTTGSTQIDSTRLSSSPYQPTFDVKEPTAAGTVLPLGTATIGSSDPDAGEMVYYTGEFIRTADVITVIGHVVLVVSGDFKIGGTAQIIVGTSTVPDSSLQIIVKGKSSTFQLDGNVIENRTGRAKNLAIFYLGDPDEGVEGANPTISNPVPSATHSFCGVVYAPNCNLDFVVSCDLNFTGSIVAKTVTFSGSPEIHYDLDLRKLTTKFSCLDTPFMVSSWQEIVP
jgi:hypothetical protein